MKNLFGKFLGNKNKESTEVTRTKVDPYCQEDLDSIFAKHFTQNGGHFNYEGTFEEFEKTLVKILENLGPEQAFCIQPTLQRILEKYKVPFSEEINTQTDIAFIDCECLVAYDGSVMVSYDNIKRYKPNNLPANIIIVSSPEQLVSNRSTGLEHIKRSKPGHLPNNITSINAKKSQEFLKKDYIKELYLLLIEENFN